jgi:haloalkane dehalogenase
MHYVDEGAGRPVVFVHGNPTWSFYYRDLIKALRALPPNPVEDPPWRGGTQGGGGFRVIAPDHIGCGLSDKPQDYPYTLATHVENFGRLMDHLALDDVTLAVHDWGGPIGLGWAVRNPHRVRSLVVFNTAAFLEGRMPLRIRMSRWPLVGSIGVRGLNLFARAAVRMACVRRERMTPQVAAGYLQPYDSYRNRVAVLRFVQDIPFNPRVPSHSVMAETERLLPTLADKPMAIFWGAKDFVFTDEYLTVWRRRFPQAAVHRYADAGHYVVEDAHERILPELRRFL